MKQAWTTSPSGPKRLACRSCHHLPTLHSKLAMHRMRSYRIRLRNPTSRIYPVQYNRSHKLVLFPWVQMKASGNGARRVSRIRVGRGSTTIVPGFTSRDGLDSLRKKVNVIDARKSVLVPGWGSLLSTFQRLVSSDDPPALPVTGSKAANWAPLKCSRRSMTFLDLHLNGKRGTPSSHPPIYSIAMP